MSKLLLQNIEDLIPKSLDDIFRQNRDLVELGLSSLSEIAALQAEIQPGMPVTDVFDDWRFISLRDKLTGRVKVILLGVAQKKGSERITSEVLRINLSEDSVFTRSGSHYGLGTMDGGEPPNASTDPRVRGFPPIEGGRIIGRTPTFFTKTL